MKYKAGILFDKPMDDKFVNIPNDNKENVFFCRLNHWLEILDTSLKATNQKSMKVLKDLELIR